MTTSLILLVLTYLLAPALIIYASRKIAFLDKLGTVLVAYVFGLLLGGLNLVPENAAGLQDIFMSLSIPLAIPMLLFTSRLSEWKKMAGNSFKSMILAMISLVAMVALGFYLFQNTNPELWKISGLLVGLYTGGTPNLASLKLMLDVDENIYLLTHTYDMMLSGVYLLFLLLAGQRVFLLFLKPFRKSAKNQIIENNSSDPYREMLSKPNRKGLLKILGASALIFVFAGGLGQLVPPSLMMVTVILLITTFGMLGSAVPSLRKTPYSFELGMYLILVFSVTVSSMVNIKDMIHASPQLILYISLVVFGSLLLHVILARIFKIDADTVLITSTALICSPPFVPVVAASIHNKTLIVPGLTVGIIGYAAGNYLGFIVAEILHWI
ncbi:MAG: DUF819 family protein [Bacteroidales bacterium]|nr:DUF819 family protein [Bacteroidales bacterium]